MNDFPENSEFGESVLYADDDTENVSDKNPDILEGKLQEKANLSTQWISDNKMVCSGDKTKLLVVGTSEMRQSKLISKGRTLQVEVCGKVIKESSDEKLLGVVMSNNLTWKTHLHGNKLTGPDKITGLLPQLSQRVGMLRQLSKLMSKKQFRNTCDGIFTSKLLYCVQLYMNVWGLKSMDLTPRRFSAFTKEDCRQLQVLQNKVLRLKTGIWEHHTPTSILLDKSGDLSVHQLGALHTITTGFKAINQGKPKHLATKLRLRKPSSSEVFPLRKLNTIDVNCSLTISRSGFVFRAAQLWNSLPGTLRSETLLSKFKPAVKKWVKENVPRKPP